MVRFRFCFLLLLLTVSPLLQVSAQQPSKPKPNIIVFMVDDMGWQDTSVPFWKEATPLNKRFHTPNMERMAREGMKFTNAYATPLCTPSRVSLMTGLNATRHRITNWVSPNVDTNTDYPDPDLQSVDWNINGYSPVGGVRHTVTARALPAILAGNGYQTIHCGKAHFGSAQTPGADPLNLGFAVNIAGSEIGHPASYLGTDNYDRPVNGKRNRNAVPGLEKYHGTDTFLSDALTTEALKAVDASVKNHQPFFLYLAHYAVHTPIMADKRFVDKYLKAGLPVTEANYASLVEGMDKSLGDVIDYLDAHQLSENTLILFMSDNGGLSTVPARSAPAHTHNLPLRAGKGSVYEGGIREPMLARWPKTIKAGSQTEVPVIIEDFFPTLLEVAGIRNAVPQKEIDGQSFATLFRKQAGALQQKRAFIWHHPNHWIAEDGPAISWASAMRQGDWKLVYQHKSETLELYNLADDIGESRDLIFANPKQSEALIRRLSGELARLQAQWPVVKRTNQPVKTPAEAWEQMLAGKK